MEIKGNQTNPSNNEISSNKVTLSQFNEETKGLAKESIGSSDFGEAINNTTRKTNVDGRLEYAYSDMRDTEQHPQNRRGAPSLMNEYALVYHPRCNTSNDYFDIANQSGAFPKHSSIDSDGNGVGGRYPRLESLLETHNSEDTPSTPYYVSDFLYSKHVSNIPLNHLITLRRYPFPTYDNLTFADGQQYKPIAQAITYFGEPTGNSLKDIMKITGFLNWKELEADVHDVDGNEKGSGDTPFIPRGAGKLISLLNGKTDLAGRQAAAQEQARLDENYMNKTLGPVNVVNKTHIRDRGLGATQEIDLVFEYDIKSRSSINPKIAMIDIICNMLALTFNNAKFWGGANRYFPNHQQFGFIGDQDAFYRGDYGTYIDSFIGDIGAAFGNGLDIFKSMIRNVFSGNFKDVFSSIVKGVGVTLLDLKAARSRPQVLGFKALLTGAPMGEWHLTVGNPYNPIAMIGNLICTGYEIEFGETLGADDFPTEIKFTVNLKYGRPRDKGDLESILNMGMGRVYHSPLGVADATNLSSATGTIIKPDNKSNFDNKSKKRDETYVKDQPDNSGNGRNGTVDADYYEKLKGSVF
jgi:hypothetical protein